jgi:redox-sensitive bicupin YhaK (pirin superfamily)
MNSLKSRQIVHKTRGRGHGITRLASPGDLGLLIKPFVFLDHVDIEPIAQDQVIEFMKDYYHPHSGIATVTTLLSGDVRFEDTTGRSGVLPAGGIECMQAGGGVWHTGAVLGPERARGFQLWVALPPQLENSPAVSTYLMPNEVEQDGPARVILGSYGKARSQLLPTSEANYLHVSLEKGERWTYRPPEGHDVAWIAVYDGDLEVSGAILNRELAVFEEGSKEIEVIARDKVDFVLGSAVKHPYPLALGMYSVHTSREALEIGEAEIEEIERKELPMHLKLLA